jgi:acyl-CoA thioester hydrolase
VALHVPYRSVQRVYFDDLDALNILHNVRYLLFMERARGEFFNELGFRWEDDLSINPDKFHVVAEHHVQYVTPFRGEGEVVVEVTPIHLGTSSFAIAGEVKGLHGSIVYARGETRLVRLDPTTQKSCTWSARFRTLVAPLVQSARA